MAEYNQHRNRPVYMIGVAAELAGVHPQTLRIYERKRLICPQRSAGNTRLYSQADIDRLRTIHQLTQDEGVNLAGVERIIELQREIERLHVEMAEMRSQLERARREVSRPQGTSVVGMVQVQRGHMVRRQPR